MSSNRMPWTPAHARPLSGFCCRNVTNCCALHWLKLSVPPYRPTLSAGNVPPEPVGGVTLDWSVPTEGENGLSPADETGSSVSSSASASSSPPDSATTATTAPSPTSTTTRTIDRAFHETVTPPPGGAGGAAAGTGAVGSFGVMVRLQS